MKFACLLLLFVFMSALIPPSFAQEGNPLDEAVDAVFRADETTPLVGEPVELALVATLPPGFELVEWPDVAGEWDEMEIAEPGERTVTNEHGSRIITQTFTLRIWKPDDFSTPEVFIGYRAAGDDEVKRIPVRPVFFSVPTVLDRSDLNLRPALSPVSFFYLPLWALLLIVLAASGGIYAGWRWWLRDRLAARRNIQLALSPAQEAERQLAAINGTEHRAGSLATVNAALRTFLDQQFGLETQALTTAEMRTNLDLRTRLTEEHIHPLFKLLEQMDLARFTPTQIKTETIEQFIQQARRWIAAVDLWTKRKVES